MIDVKAFAKDALKSWDYGSCNCMSSVAAAAPSCARAFALWKTQPIPTRRRQAKSKDVLSDATRFAVAAGCAVSTGPEGWGVISTNGREAVALKHAGRWLLRLWPKGVAVLKDPIVLRQWSAD